MPHGFARALRFALIAAPTLAISCNGAFDLFVDLLTVPDSVRPGENLLTSSRVCNRGDTPNDADVLELSVRSLAAPLPDEPVGSRPVPPLQPGQCHSEETLLVAPLGLPDGAYELVGHLLTSGHERTSRVFGLGHGPDLFLEELHGPPSAEPWNAFDVSARVCNRGTAWATGSSLDLYLSEDWTLLGAIAGGPESDELVGSLPVPDLPAGACVVIEGTPQANVPGDGPYVLGAIVDEPGFVAELVEQNNARLLQLIGVGWLPDLVVRSLSGPSSTLNGPSFDVDGVVCNDGTVSSPETELSVFFSKDTKIEPPAPPNPAAGDFWLGELPVPSLPPGTCGAVAGSVDGGVPSDGEWILGAFVDEASAIAELIEPNNTLAGPRMGVGSGPDLVVEGIVAPPSAEHGVSFPVEVEVCNRGTAPADPSLLRLFLSTDALLEELPPGGDPEIGVVPVDPVMPGACVDAVVDALADSSLSGAARLFAQADAWDGIVELVESNNETLGPWIGVGFEPDLVVRSISAPPSAFAGASFAVSLELCNQGTTPSAPTSVALYHSTDPTIEGAPLPGPGSDLYAGELVLTASLMPGACTQLSGMGTAEWSADGAYYLGAFADEIALVDELQESNNAFTGPLMGIGDGPDLVVTRLDAPPTALPDSSLLLDFEVCNQGTAPSDTTLVAFYDSADAVIETGPPPPGPDPDRWLGDETVPYLGPGSCHAGTASVWLPAGDLGERILGAIADESDASPELVESNNVFVGGILGVGNGPDLVVAALVAPPSVTLSGALSVDTQVCNQGTGPSDPAFLSLYLSDDEAIEGSYFPPAGDPWFGEVSVPMLAPGACHDETVVSSPGVPHEGAWHLGGIVDEALDVDELVESNNTTLGPLVGVGDGSDLVVDSLDVPASAEIGAPVPVSARVCNQGTAPSVATDVTLVHSQDDEIESGFPGPPGPDLFFAYLPLTPLLPGACLDVFGTGSAGAPSEGPWFAGAIVDEGQLDDELVESNNTLVGPVMGLGFAPDLVIQTLDPPASVTIGVGFSVDTQVCNQGTDTAAPSLIALYHSDDDTLDVGPVQLPDTYLVDAVVPALAPGACHLDALAVPGVPGPGFLAALADDGLSVSELIETNNVQLTELTVTGP